jgi:transcriptional regulator with XRE-family HTH domain
VPGDYDRAGEAYRNFGAYLRSQRQLAQLTLRQLAELSSISNPYLSQIERGLHQPSVAVIRSIAGALNLSADALLAQVAGLDDTDAAGPSLTTESAIRADPRLTSVQKAALLSVYRSMVGIADEPESGGAAPASKAGGAASGATGAPSGAGRAVQGTSAAASRETGAAPGPPDVGDERPAPAGRAATGGTTARRSAEAAGRQPSRRSRSSAAAPAKRATTPRRRAAPPKASGPEPGGGAAGPAE